MTDEPDDPMDSLLSADLDGETTPAEHDRIEADAELRARRDELRLASDLVAEEPPPLNSVAVDEAVNRALGASAPVVESPLAQIAARRQHRRPPRAVQWLVAAAIVLLAGTGLALIVTDRSPSRHVDTATRVVPTVHPSAESRSKSAAPSVNAGGLSGSTLRSIGTFATPAALRSALATRVPASRDAASSSAAPTPVLAGQADRCATVVEARDPRLIRSRRLSVVAASIAGKPVVVLEYRARAVDNTRQTTRVIAVGVAACNERLDFQR